MIATFASCAARESRGDEIFADRDDGFHLARVDRGAEFLEPPSGTAGSDRLSDVRRSRVRVRQSESTRRPTRRAHSDFDRRR